MVGRLAGWLVGWLVDCSAGWLVRWLVGWFGWLVGWLAGWLAGWLVGWLFGGWFFKSAGPQTNFRVAFLKHCRKMRARKCTIGERSIRYRRVVYDCRNNIFARVKYAPERAMDYFQKLLTEDIENAEWVAAHVCMLKAKAKQGAWSYTERDQRRRYVLQLRRFLEAPSEPELFFIEPAMSESRP